MGSISIISLFCILVAMWGCFALSTEPDIVRRTYWTSGDIHNDTSSHEYSIYIGLRSVIYVNCTFIPGTRNYGSNCLQESIIWGSDQCKSNDIINSACDNCSGAATNLWLTAVGNHIHY